MKLTPSKLHAIMVNLCAIGGLGLITIGLWQIHQPTSLVVVGAILLAGGVKGGLR